MKKKLPIIMTITMTITMIGLHSSEDDPRLEAHNKLTDRLIALGDEQAQAKERERMAFLAESRGDDEIEEDEDL